MFFFLIPYFTSFIQLLTWQNASCMYYILWGSKVYKEKKNVPRTLVIQRYASTNLPRQPLFWTKKMMDKALIVLFSCQHPTYLLMNYPIYHFHLPLSPSFQKVLLKILYNHIMGKGAQYSMGCFSSNWDVHISMGCAPLFNGCSYLLWTPFSCLQSWVLLFNT